MEHKVQQTALSGSFCRIIGVRGNHGIAFGFLWRGGVFGSLSHFRRSSGAVPPWAPCRWAHVWRNEPRAITLSLSLCVCRLLPAFCLPLAASPPFYLISVPSSPPPLIISPLFSSCISFLSPVISPVPPVAAVSWGCRVGTVAVGGLGRRPGKTSSLRR